MSAAEIDGTNCSQTFEDEVRARIALWKQRDDAREGAHEHEIAAIKQCTVDRWEEIYAPYRAEIDRKLAAWKADTDALARIRWSRNRVLVRRPRVARSTRGSGPGF